MKIPKTIKLFGRTIKIKVVAKVNKEFDHLGEYLHDDGIIKIKRGLSQEDTEQVYLHELTHAILLSLGKDSLSDDEPFVDTFASLLHQSIKTAKYQP